MPQDKSWRDLLHAILESRSLWAGQGRSPSIAQSSNPDFRRLASARSFGLWVSLFGLGCHALAIAVFLNRPRIASLPQDWALQFWMLLSLSVVCSLAANRFERKVLPAILFGLQIFVLTVADYPEGRDLILTFIFIIIINVTMFSLVRPMFAMVLVFDLGLVGLFRIRPVPLWNDLPSIPRLADSALLFFGVALSSVLLTALGRLSEAYNETKFDVDAMKNSINNLLNANVDFQNHAIEVGKQSTIEERKRMSREVHDIVGYTLINLKMMLESGIDLAGEGNIQLSELLRRARDQAQSGLGETRMALQAFRDMEHSRMDLVAGLQVVVTLFSKATGIEVEVSYGNIAGNIDEDLGVILRRIVQESMTNSFRHGRATRIKIGFWIADGRLSVKIDDDGQGAAEIHPGIGLIGMRERVEGLGGNLEFSNSGYGFCIRAEMPVGQGRSAVLPPPVTDLAVREGGRG